MNILVTGGTGFIGENFIPRLLEEGNKVRLLVRNLDKAKKIFGETCEYFVGDVTEKNSLKGVCENIDIVFHMVAKVGNELPTEESMRDFRAVNVQGTKNMVEEAKISSVKKFIYISSIAAMGIVKKYPINEESLCEPYLPYQITKYEAEQVINNEFRKDGFPGIVVRPTKVYGVGEHEYSFLTLAKLCRKHLFIKVGREKNYISNIYITDFVQCLCKLVDNGVIGETYIATSKDSIEFKEAGKTIAKELGKKIIILYIPARLMIILARCQERLFIKLHKRPVVTEKNIEATINDRVYDIKKAKDEIGYQPELSMKKGIKLVVDWYVKKKIL